MKKFLLFTSLIAGTSAYAQINPIRHPDSTGILAIGEKFPDIPFGKIMDNQGKTYSSWEKKQLFNQLDKKILIFDFFQQNCGSCIEGFVKMTKLQEEFKNDIQIFLVNYDDKEDNFRKWMQKHREKGNEMIPANLPILIEAYAFRKLFPPEKSTGYQVWVGKDKKLLFRGDMSNTHAGKIRQYLAGEEIRHLRENENVYNPAIPYFISKNNSSEPPRKYYSEFALFEENVHGWGSYGINQIDKAANTKRNTYLNATVGYLMEESFKDLITGDKKYFSGKRTWLDVPNTERYFRDKLSREYTDMDLRKNNYCYEQVVPADMPEAERLKLMRQDMVHYFNREIGLICEMRTVERDCYKIIRSAKTSNSKPTGNKAGFSRKWNSQTNFYVYTHMTVSEVFGHYFELLHYTQPGKILSDPEKTLVIDGTDGKELINITLPEISDLDMAGLRKALQEYGFDIVPSKEKVDILVFQEKMVRVPM